jgi:acetylornithine deacetylase/succinyl-diaminopimelate desuccinylase-like protein
VIAADLRQETCRLLAELIRIDTSNPPGNETAAAEHLAAYLADAGVESTIVGRTPGRGSIVARIPGTGEGPSLMLLSHTDVVPAEAGDWSVPPFSGEDRDGFIWGRGALDMKGQAAAEAVAVATLAREGWRGSGDLIFCSVADEEVGTADGLAWVVEAHPDLVRADMVVNEGGGQRFEHEGRVAYTVGVGEKRCSAFAVTLHGKSGHASTPRSADNALLKLAEAASRIAHMRLPQRDLPEVAAFLDAIGEAGSDPHALLARAGASAPVVAELLEPMLGAVVAPTGAEASASVNVIPGRARLVCDCRILPGQTQDEVERAVRDVLSGLDFSFEFIEHDGGTISPPDSPLYRAIADLVPRIEPGAAAAPVICSGFTDSHWMREAFGSAAYGFMPMRLDAMVAGAVVHSADERADKDDLELGTRAFVDLARAVLA